MSTIEEARKQYIVAQLKDPEGDRLEIAEVIDICTKWSDRATVVNAPTLCGMDMRKLGRALLQVIDENNFLRQAIDKIQKGEIQDGKDKGT
jgi:hypothetical protein